MSAALAELRSVLRGLRRRPRFAVAAALAAALGVAAFGTVGALVDAALVAPLPFPQAERLERIWMSDPASDPRIDLSVPEIAALERATPALERIAASARVRLAISFDDGAERIRGEAVSSGYFELLGLAPALGRVFAARDAGQPVALLSHALWQRRFAADPAVLGRALRTPGATFTIVGVLPAWFHGAIEDDEVEVFVPFEFAGTPAQRADRERRHVWALGRLGAADAGPALAAQLAALSERLHAEDPKLPPRWRLTAEPFAANWREGLRGSLPLLALAAATLLLVGAANAAALLGVRARSRRAELALRGALGAPRATLAAGRIAESVAIVGAGGLVGLAASWPLLRLFLAFAPGQLPGYVRLAPNPAALAIGLLTVVAIGALAGALPAREALAAAPIEALRAAGRTTIGAGRRSTRALLASQLALSMVALATGAHVLGAVARLANAPLGFPRAGILRLALTVSPLDLAAGADADGVVARLRDRLASMPRVAEVGLVEPTLPPWDGWRPRVLDLPSSPPEGLPVGGHRADAGLYRVFGLRPLAGRLPSASEESARAPVAVVSAGLAAELGGVEAAVGRALRLDDRDLDVHGRFTVIGVVPDVAWDGLREQDTGRALAGLATPRADLYLPFGASRSRQFSIALASHGAPAALEPAARAAIASVLPNSPVHWVSTMADEVAYEYRGTTFLAWIADAFAAVAAALAGAGLLAFLSARLLERRRELALRRALGARGLDLLAIVGRELAGLLLPAVAVGALGSIAARTWLARAAADAAPGAAATLAGAGIALLAAVVVAALPPTWRALRADPMAALRDE